MVGAEPQKCVRQNSFLAIRWNEMPEDPAPEGRTNLAQRFKRWEEYNIKIQVPEESVS